MEYIIRKAIKSDIENVYMLSNEAYVREYSINKSNIEWESHLSWFDEILKSTKDYFYIIVDENKIFCGQIRFKVNPSIKSEVTVSISLAKNTLGKGLSSYFLKSAIEILKKEYNLLKTVNAVIKDENIKSIKTFENVGFVYLFRDKSFSYYHYII